MLQNLLRGPGRARIQFPGQIRYQFRTPGGEIGHEPGVRKKLIFDETSELRDGTPRSDDRIYQSLVVSPPFRKMEEAALIPAGIPEPGKALKQQLIGRKNMFGDSFSPEKPVPDLRENPLPQAARKKK